MHANICVAGNIVVDRLYPISGYPSRGHLTNIGDGIAFTPGGAVCNTGMDLAALLPEANIRALGVVGQDADGDFAVQCMVDAGMDCTHVRRGTKATSFTAVMNDAESGERTFFTHAGANSELDLGDFPFDALDVTLLHIGYLLLLDKLDAVHDECGTRMAYLLREAQRRDIKTSIDIVSATGDRFARTVPPALRYTDYCIINELESSATTGIPLRDADGSLIEKNIPAVLTRMHEMGVSEWAVIHAPEGGYGMGQDGKFVSLPSLRLPKGFIRDKVGAGDAFCAGVLAGAACDWDLCDSIRLGAATAAMSLSAVGATAGVGSIADAMELCRQYGA